MSFHWNLSSEDELEGEDEDKEDPPIRGWANTPQNDFTSPHTSGAFDAIVTKPAETLSDDDDGGDIDWEDADSDANHEEDDQEENSKLSERPLRPVTITLEENKERRSDIGPQGRKRNRKVYRNAMLSSDLRDLLNNLHKTHLLSLMSRAVLLSRTCSNPIVLHIVQSLMPLQLESETSLPSLKQVRNLCLWYFDFVNRVEQRRRFKMESNAAAGAPIRGRRRQKGCGSKSRQSCHATPTVTTLGHGDVTSLTMMQLCAYLSSINDENPQLAIEAIPTTTNTDKVQLLVALFRSLGWRARYVVVLDPIDRDLDVNHPLFVMGAAVNVFQNFLQKSKRVIIDELSTEASIGEDTRTICQTLAWVEVLCQGEKKPKWIHIDIDQEWINEPRFLETLWYAKKRSVALNSKRRLPVMYVLGVEHLIKDGETLAFRLTDVTPRYSNSWSKSQRMRGDDCHEWFAKTIQVLNSVGCVSLKQSPKALTSSGHTTSDAIDVDTVYGNVEVASRSIDDEIDEAEKADLAVAASLEIMPTTKSGFVNHAAYALASQLGTQEVLAPDAKSRICGMFKGEVVYRRSDVSTAKTAKKWLYDGRKVGEDEKPIKRIKARKKSTPAGFRKLKSYGVGVSNDGSENFRDRQIALGSAPESDENEDLFAYWQTEPWSPAYIGPTDAIPINEYKNIELALLNPGLMHLDRPRMAKVAKTLGIPYAPCLLGFEGHGGNRTPTIRGIVVHEHNVDILNEAFVEFERHAIEREQNEQETKVLKRWKKLIHGILLRDRLERDYGGDKGEE